MINIKLIRKKATTTGTASSGSRYTGGTSKTDYASEAGHATTAANLDSDSSDWEKIDSKDAAVLDSAKDYSDEQDEAQDAENLKKFLRKDIADTAAGKITFSDGAGFGDSHGIDKDGNATLGDVEAGDVSASGDVKAEGTVESDTVISKTRNDAVEDIQGGKGFKLWVADGVASLIVDRLTVRMKAIFAELEVRKLTYSAGNLNLSAAGAKLVATAELDADGNLYHAQPVTFFSVGGSLIADSSKLLYIGDTAAAHSATAVTARCWFLADDGETQTDQTFHAGDMVMCKTFNINEGAYKDVANRYYWRTVTDASTSPVENGGKKYHWIDLSLTETCKIVKDTADDGTKTYYDKTVTADGVTSVTEEFPGYDTVTGVENDTPAPYDEVATVGSLVDEARRNVVQLAAVGEDYAPAVNMYDKIGEGGVYCLLSDHWPVRLSPKGCFINTEYLHVAYGDNSDKALGEILSSTDSSLNGLTDKYNTLAADVTGLTSRVGGIKKDDDGNVVTLESELKQTAEEISLMVSSQRAGKNLWLDGGFDMTTGAPKYYHNVATSTVAEEDRIDNVDLPAGFTARLVFSCREVGNGMFFLKKDQPYITLESGNDYCMSLFIKATAACTVQIGLEGLYTEDFEVGLGWNRVSLYIDKATYGDSYSSWDGSFVIYPQSDIGEGNYVCVTGIQFEVGGKSSGAPTVWSKSVYDTETALEKTGIDIKDGKITLTADNITTATSEGKEIIYIDAADGVGIKNINKFAINTTNDTLTLYGDSTTSYLRLETTNAAYNYSSTAEILNASGYATLRCTYGTYWARMTGYGLYCGKDDDTNVVVQFTGANGEIFVGSDYDSEQYGASITDSHLYIKGTTGTAGQVSHIEIKPEGFYIQKGDGNDGDYTFNKKCYVQLSTGSYLLIVNGLVYAIQSTAPSDWDKLEDLSGTID